MARITTDVQPIDQDIQVILDETLSPQARADQLAEFAKEEIRDAQRVNALILGRVPPTIIIVDGQHGVRIDDVKPEGTVFAEFELIEDVLQYIDAQLEAHSPILTGRYQKSHVLFADGAEVSSRGAVPFANEYVFINTQPYARKIERGLSSQSPAGVYQVVAALARRKFGNNIAKIEFSFRAAVGGRFVQGRGREFRQQRQPAIIVKVR